MLQHAERVKLLYGPYRMPKCKRGRWVRCHIRGLVKVVGITDAPVQWPYTPRSRRDKRPSVIVCGDLVRALRRESAAAVAYWWGVSIVTVWRWRTELGIQQFTEGTRALYSRRMSEWLDDEKIARMRKALSSPEAIKRRADARRGKPMPEHVKKALVKANKGRRPSREIRRRMSEAQKRRTDQAFGVVWTPEDHALLGTMSDKDLAKEIGRTVRAVRTRRHQFGIPCTRKLKPRTKPPKWTRHRLRLLGTLPDAAIATKLRCTHYFVFTKRNKLGIPAFRPIRFSSRRSRRRTSNT